MTKDHHKNALDNSGKLASAASLSNLMLGSQSKFLTTSRMLRLFSAGVKAPEPGMRVVYVDGSFDMFHAGHISFLAKAKEHGDYLIVGVHSDVVVNEHEGTNMPIMNLHERVLSVLGCRFTDDVLIDAPYTLTKDMVAALNVSKVIRGNNYDLEDEKERYSYAMSVGIYKQIKSPCDFCLNDIFNRIQRNQSVFQLKIDKKKKKEEEYYDERYKENKNYKKKQSGKEK